MMTRMDDSRRSPWMAAILLASVGCVVVAARADEPAATATPAPDETGPRLPPAEPVPPADLEDSISRGVAFLLESQRKDGSWGSADNTKGGVDIYAPAPGAHHAFRSAVTALCVSALIEADPDSRNADVQAAIGRGEAWLLENLPRLRRASPDTLYNVWGHAYGIETLALLYRRHAGDAAGQERIAECIRGQIDLLERYESVNGGWGYYDFDVGARKTAASPNSFTTATVLLALADAKDLGIDVPQKIVDRGLEAIRRQTKPDRSYLYGDYLKYVPTHPVNRPGGSLGRSQACNAALRRYGDEDLTDAAIRAWLERLFARNGWLSLGRKKPIPHESWFAVAGYFFYYGHFYAAECIRMLPEQDRGPLKSHLARIMMPLQEPNGCFWDYTFYDYHTQYGTAFAVRTLVRCRP
jgi:hypothetical protein